MSTEINVSKGNGSILFVAYGGGHVAMLAPVFKALLDAGRPAVFLALTTAAAYMETLGLPYIGYRSLPGAIEPSVLAYGEKLAQGLPAGGSVSKEETIAYLGLNYRELVAKYGEVGASDRYENQGRQAFLPVALFERWFSEIRPAVVIASNSPRSEQAALLAAGRLGISSVCTVDIFGLQEIKWIGLPGYADRVCVLNEQVRQMFVEYGRGKEEVVVTGNPVFEELLDPEIQEAGERFRSMRGWGRDEVVILWASQVEPEKHPFADRKGDPSLPRRIEAALRKFVAENAGFHLVIRYHPSERVDFENGQARVHFSPCHEKLAVLLHAIDLTVVTASTVGLQAYLAGKIVISVDDSIFTEDAPYSRMGISFGVKELDDLDKALLKLCENMNSRAGKDENAGLNIAGSATKNIIQVVDSLHPDFEGLKEL